MTRGVTIFYVFYQSYFTIHMDTMNDIDYSKYMGLKVLYFEIFIIHSN
jgi:hypothetical protein